VGAETIVGRVAEKSERKCDLCGVHLEWRRPTGRRRWVLAALPVAMILLDGFVLAGGRGAGWSPEWFALPNALIVVGVTALFLALGGGGLLLSRWEVCPRCADFRLPDESYRSLVQIEWLSRRIVWYLLVPAAFFLFLAAVAGTANRRPWLQLTLAFAWAGMAAQLGRFLRPRRRPPKGERWAGQPTGIRIPEDEG
jgi:hypothetical protein